MVYRITGVLREIMSLGLCDLCFFFQAEDGIRDLTVTGVQTCALPILDDVVQDVEEDHDRRAVRLAGTEEEERIREVREGEQARDRDEGEERPWDAAEGNTKSLRRHARPLRLADEEHDEDGENGGNRREQEDETVLFSSRRRDTRFDCDWSSDVCSSD